MTEHYLDRLARTINENWDKPALTDFYLTEDGSAQDTSRGNHYTYGEMYQEILRLNELFRSLGLQKGDHIALCGANSAHWAIAYLAIAAYQGVTVTIHHSHSPEHIACQIAFSDAKALITDEALWDELKSLSIPKVKYVMSLNNWQGLQGEKFQIPTRKLKIENQRVHFDYSELDSLAMICFTSGSTGSAKGVMLSYRNVSSNVMIFNTIPLRSARRHIVGVLPLSHNFGLFTDFLSTLCYGERLFLPQDEMIFETYTIACNLIQPSYVEIVPSTLQNLLSYGIKANVSVKHFLQGVFGGRFQGIVVGGAEIPVFVEQSLIENDIGYLIGYGASECGIFISYYSSENHLQKTGSVGKIVYTLESRIASNGEILVKGENVMLGYYKDPEATARKIDADGWLHTGDKGHLDEDGYLYVEGRLEQDMIVLPNGENILPRDIELKINALSEVTESIVLARNGKLIAIVVLSPSFKVTDRMKLHILHTINPQLPLYSQLYDVELTNTPLLKTEKQTIKRYLYK